MLLAVAVVRSGPTITRTNISWRDNHDSSCASRDHGSSRTSPCHIKRAQACSALWLAWVSSYRVFGTRRNLSWWRCPRLTVRVHVLLTWPYRSLSREQHHSWPEEPSSVPAPIIGAPYRHSLTARESGPSRGQIFKRCAAGDSRDRTLFGNGNQSTRPNVKE